MKHVVKNAEIILHIFLFAVLFLISLYKIFEKPGLWFTDEFGYSGTAAFLSGMDWSDQISHISYFGVGYGILLVPAYSFCTSAKQIMVYIGCLHVFLFLLTFELVVRFCKIMFSEENNYLLYLISFFIMLYPNNIVQLQMGWSETLNLLLYWVTINILINIFLKNATNSYVFLALIQCYALMVHMRNIGLAAAAMSVLFIYWIALKKFNIKKILIFFLVMILGLFAFWVSKNYIQAVLWNNSSTVQMNDISGRVSSVQTLFRLEGVISFAKSVACKYFYIAASSYGLVIFGIIYAFNMIVNRRIELAKRLVALYSILSFLFCFFLGSFTMMRPGRVDTVIYGRYFETCIGALLCFAFYSFCKDYEISGIIKKGCIILFGMFIGAFVGQELINSLSNHFNVYVCIAGLADYFLRGYDVSKILFRIFVMCTFYFSIAISCFFISLKCKWIKKYVPIICFGCIISLFWLRTAKKDLDMMIVHQNERYVNITPVSEAILENEYTFKSNENIYYFQEMNEEWNEYLLGLQLMIGHNALLNVNYDNWDTILETQPYYIVTKNGYKTNDITLIDNFQNNYIPVSATREFILYRHSEAY